jgi:predicted metal-dependent phosphoesterase TrpH
MIKVDLHMHCGEDPEDGLWYPATKLLDKAAREGFAAIAITLHGKVLEDARVFEYARQRGVLLIKAVEWKIQGSDVVLCNVTGQSEVEQLHTWDDLRALRRARGASLLVIAPHPYYPVGHSLRGVVEQHLDLFDAIEHAQIHLPWLNFNRRAVDVALEHGKPVVANSDAHNLWMFGRHYTRVDAVATAESIFAAIRAGKVQWVSPPLTVWECVKMFVTDPLLHRKPKRVIQSYPAIRPCQPAAVAEFRLDDGSRPGLMGGARTD